MILIPENATRKIDSIGRITLPKGLRDRMVLPEDTELELFTATIDGRQCICLAKPHSKEDAIEEAMNLLMENGYTIGGFSYD